MDIVLFFISTILLCCIWFCVGSLFMLQKSSKWIDELHECASECFNLYDKKIEKQKAMIGILVKENCELKKKAYAKNKRKIA